MLLPSRAAAAAPVVEYSLDGKRFTPLGPVEGRQRPADYYDYAARSGHPAFGTAPGVSSVALYADSKRGGLSLMLVNGSADPRDADEGSVAYRIDGLPFSSRLLLSDDPDEFAYDPGQSRTSPAFNYRGHTDGAVFGGLERAHWTITISLARARGIDRWRLIDIAPDGSDDPVELSRRAKLYLRYTGDSTTPTATGGNTHSPAGNGTTGGARHVSHLPVSHPFEPPDGNLPLLGPYAIRPGGPGSEPPPPVIPVPEPASAMAAALLIAALSRRPGARYNARSR